MPKIVQYNLPPAGTVTIGSTEGDISIGGASAKLSFARAGGVAINCSHGSGELYFQMAGSNKVKFAANGNVGIATTAPGQILDVNSGSGNIIADGYDTHSLSRYKENVSVAGTGYLERSQPAPRNNGRVFHLSRLMKSKQQQLRSSAKAHGIFNFQKRILTATKRSTTCLPVR